MWDENRPMKLIGALKYDSASMQGIIDVDKYVEGAKLGCDLCGRYAPFCKVCNKDDRLPCITAYSVEGRMRFVCPLIMSTGLDDAETIQKVIDLDKLLGSEKLGIDLCGRYAPFCTVCDKSQHAPCGNAYLRYTAVTQFHTRALTAQAGGELVVTEQKTSPDEEAAAEAATADGQVIPEEQPKHGYRIGIAKRRKK